MFFNKKPPSVSLSFQNTPLRMVLEELSLQTQINIVYADALIEDISVNCNFINLPVDRILRRLLRNRSLSFRWINRKQIVLIPLVQSHFDVSGYVKDAKSGESLPYANINVVGTHLGTVTNQEGHFVLLNMPPHPCSLKVQYIGYSPEVIPLNPNRSSSKNFQINLNEKSYTTRGITIYGNSNEIIQISKQPSQLALSPENFSTLPMFGDKDIFRSLFLLPGITSDQGFSGPRIRGSLQSETLVLLDDIPIFHLEHLLGFLSAFSMDAIKDIRIYKSGFPAKLGNKISGVIELNTKSGNFNTPRFELTLTPLNSSALISLPLFGKGALLASGRHSHSSHIVEQFYQKRLHQLNNDVAPLTRYEIDGANYPFSVNDLQAILKKATLYDLLTKLTLAPSSKDLLTFTGYWEKDLLDIERQSVFVKTVSTKISQKAVMSARQKQSGLRWGNNGYNGKWFRTWHKRFYSKIFLTYSDYFTHFLSRTSPMPLPQVSSSSHSENNYLLNAHLTNLSLNFSNKWKIHPSHTLQFGSNLSRKNIHYRYFKNDTLTFKHPYYSSELKTATAYLQDTWKPHPKLETTIGMRATHMYSFNQHYWAPRFSANYQLSKSLSLKSAWGHYFQNTIHEINQFKSIDQQISWLFADGKHLRPAFAEHYVLGSQFSNKNILFDIEFYIKRLKNILDSFATKFIINPGEKPSLRQLSGDSRGMDILLQKKSGFFQGWISYSFNQTTLQREDPQTGTPIIYPRNQNTPHTLQMVNNYSYQNWLFSAVGHYFSGTPYDIPEISNIIKLENGRKYQLTLPKIPNQNRLPDSHRLDLSLAYRLKRKHLDCNLVFSVFNVYNKKTIWKRYFSIKDKVLLPVDHYTFGRTPMVSLELKFH